MSLSANFLPKKFGQANTKKDNPQRTKAQQNEQIEVRSNEQ